MSNAPLDASRSKPVTGGPSFSLANRLERGVWRIVWFLFARAVPPPVGKGWRRVLLRIFGAKIGAGAHIYASARVWLPRHLTMASNATLGPSVECYNMAPVNIGESAIISQRAFLCTGSHDTRDPHFQLVTAPISIGRGSWIAAEAYIGPGVTIGSNAVVAARACVVSDVPAGTIWGGNPAKQIGERS